ncbi:MAG: NADH-quinone oxidoreductase subunit N [Cyclobacteriaceae bacterium]|nr:NADH-quinone oxidoreductase subunit N [Cyclobacteriaceae bacterium]
MRKPESVLKFRRVNDLLSIAPVLILAGFSILVLLVIAFYRNFILSTILAATAFILATISILFTGKPPALVNHILIADRFGMFFILLILLSGLVITILSHSYLRGLEKRKEEYHVILILGSLGGTILALSNHFISFFIGLELLSISIYILISYTRDRQDSIEAAIKYLLLAGVTSAILLMGMALIYAATGEMGFSGIAGYVSEAENLSILFSAGFGLIITGVGFKMALVPFHLWTPDVYEGAPAPTTAFIATISKASVVVIFVRLYLAVNGAEQEVIVYILSGIAFLSMMAGNLLALLQTDLKRLLAYSSIAHLGYILVAVIAGKDSGAEAVTFYLVAYVLTILGAFGIVSVVSDHDREFSAIEDYQSLFWKDPLLATALSVILLSLAGIPLTVGFIGKYYLLFTGIENDLWFLVITLVISSVIGLFYYVRVIAKMFDPVSTDRITPFRKIPVGGGIALFVITALIILYGTYPAWLADFIQTMIFSGF